MTVVIGGVMSGVSVALKPRQDKQVELDTKKQILGAVMDISNIKNPDEILNLYSEKVKSFVVDIDGNIMETDEEGNVVEAEKVNIQKNYKANPGERLYPVYTFSDNGSVSAYIFPMFGNGLWDWISCYIALDGDLNTIKGIAFDHKQETPGLGARITSDQIQGRYVGKEIYSSSGSLESVTMVKGEGNTGLSEHQVDGMSGATLTAIGVNNMLKHYLECYEAFINKTKDDTKIAINF
jgi:Na+-transporting NADH:ubiquinone oxidoreductase subunit C